MGLKTRDILFLAYYFPPLGMGGVQRAAKFARYLPQFGWLPHVITVKDIAYYAKDKSLLQEVNHVPITRTESLDPARLANLLVNFKKNKSTKFVKDGANSGHSITDHLTRLTQGIFYPDSKLLWIPFVRHKLDLLRKKTNYQAIFSTSPPISSHLVAARMNLPWIADFRDYWSTCYEIFAPTKWHRKRYQEIISLVVHRANKIIAVSEPIADSIREIAGEKYCHKICMIPNGYDSADFKNVVSKRFEHFTIVYTGNLDQQRSPGKFLAALDEILKKHDDLHREFRCIFIGRRFGLKLQPLSERLKPIVKFIDYLSHEESLSYLLGADAALFILSSSTDPGIVTGKLYEYLGSYKPILAIIPENGVPFQLLQQIPNCYFADPDDIHSIQQAVLQLLNRHDKPSLQQPDYKNPPRYLLPYTRRFQTAQLAELLDQITGLKQE